MSILVLAEHDNVALKPATQHTISAGAKISEKGGNPEVHVLVVGEDAEVVAQASARVAGVNKVFLADASHLGAQTAEAVSAQVLQHIQTGDYSHVLAPATTFGKNVLPRIAARLDVQQISGIIEVLTVDTFIRPIYAGNALARFAKSRELQIAGSTCSKVKRGRRSVSCGGGRRFCTQRLSGRPDR